MRLYHLFLLLVAIGLVGCATTNQAPFPLAQWHDMNSRFNAYFNAKEQVKEVLKTVEKTHKDDFNTVIPLYFYTNSKEFAGAAGELDAAEKRCEKSLRVHGYSNYVDDHFMLIGIANYLKGDYDKAITNFKFVTTEYKEGVDYVKEIKRLKGKSARPSKKKKPVKKPKFQKVLNDKGKLVLEKIDERPSYSAFVHEPMRAEALIWLAKAYTTQEKFTEAAAIIQYAKSDDKFYKNLDKDLLLAEADLLIRQKEYPQAIKPLEAYLEIVKKGKKKRIRPLIALGQIYERTKNYAKAADYYKQALKSNPNYDMEFFAKIQQTRLSRKAKKDISEAKKILARMSHDGKYKENYDQIYYELGEFALDEKDRSTARKYFGKSVETSTVDIAQKSRSFLRLAQMDYDDEIYLASKFNYDSALTGMSASEPNYEATVRRGKVLARLVEQLDIISAQDSLQRIAKMSPSERTRFIKRLIAQQEKEKERLEQEQQAAANAPTTPQTGATGTGSSTWYFYNVQLRTKGYADFIKKWGKRKLENNWRRKDKTSTNELTAENTTSETTTSETEKEQASGGSDEEKALANLPLSADKVTQSNDKLIDAYYASGTIYKDDLSNYRKATQQFEELLRRFPKSKLEAETYYQLYLLALKTKNNSKADLYKSKILSEYPNSAMAKYLQDGSYFAKLQESENALSKYYESAYNDYRQGLYASASDKCRQSSVKFNPNTLQPKFDLLNAMIEAKEHRLDAYVQSLNKIIAKHNGTPEQAKAKELLAAVNASSLPMEDRSKEVPQEPQPVAEQPIAQQPVAKTEIQEETTPKQIQSTELNKGNIVDMKSMLANRLNKLNLPNKDEEANKTAEPQQPKAEVKPTEQPKESASIKPETEKPVAQNEVKPKQETVTAPQVVKKNEQEAPPAKTETQPKETPKTSNEKTVSNTAKDETKPTTITKEEVKPIAAAEPKKETVTPPKNTTETKKETEVKAQTPETKTTTPAPKAETPKKEVPSTALQAASVTINLDTTDHEVGLFGKSDAAPHQVIIVFKDAQKYTADVIQKLEQFEQNKLLSSSYMNRYVFIDNNTKLVAVKPFANKETAMAFVAQLEENIKEAIGKESSQVLIYAISTLNYATLVSNKRFGNYNYFYEKHYKAVQK